LSISHDETVKLWNYDSGECIKQLPLDLSNGATCLKQASYNKVIAGYTDGTIKIIDIEADMCLKTINAHSDNVRCIQMISTEQVISCSDDKSIKLFDLNI